MQLTPEHTEQTGRDTQICNTHTHAQRAGTGYHDSIEVDMVSRGCWVISPCVFVWVGGCL